MASSALTASLTHNIGLATHLTALERALVSQREATQKILTDAKAHERRWRDKEKEMYQALQPFSSPALYARLSNAIAEAEATSEAMVESFLDDGGADGVESWVKSYREIRKLTALRRERMGRWDEGRVVGWR
jgi:hypothetical protein